MGSWHRPARNRPGRRHVVRQQRGRSPGEARETTINSYGTDVPANPKTGAGTTSTVSVTDTADNSVSVIDTRKGKVVQTIATQPWPEASVG